MTDHSTAAASAPATRRVDYRVVGLDCAEEVAALRSALDPVDGVRELGFDVLRGRLSVHFDPRRTDEPELVAAVAGTGMAAEPWSAAGAPEDDRTGDRRAALTLISGVGTALGFGRHAWDAGLGSALSGDVPGVSIGFYLLGLVAGLIPVLPKAWFALRGRRPDMNLLMVVAVSGAVALGEWFEAASVSFLFSLSLLLESWSVGRARRAVAELLDLSPSEATVLHRGTASSELPDGGAPACAEHDGHDHGHDHGGHADGGHAAAAEGLAHEHRVPADQVPVGSRVLVKPGERLPLDGRVVSGRSALDQSPITGESVPVEKGPGDEVFAGTINGGGVLEIETTRPAEETTLARIVAMVEEAQSRRSPSEAFVERFARVYTPAVMLLALLTWLVPPLVSAQSWSAALYNALVLLVIACPCALVISTPVSIVSALAAAARHGVLIKGGRYVEAPARLAAIALDKTGTLTAGQPVVHDVLPLDDHTDDDLLRIAAAIESRATHPLAQAIVSAAAERQVSVPAVSDVVTLPGQGVEAVVDGHPFWIGSHRYLERRGQETPEVHETLERLEADGHTVVVLGTDDHVCGMITLLDEPRAGAQAAVDGLHQLGVKHLVLLTGDNAGTAGVIARELGLDECRAELLPEDKLEAIEDLVATHGEVAMVGDGVNDAPALARSSLGVALGAAGTDAAIETADIVIMSDDLTRLPWLVHHARRTLAVIRQNIVASLAIKALFVLLALAGWASLWGAIAADMGVSLLVVANALRLLRSEPAPVGSDRR